MYTSNDKLLKLDPAKSGAQMHLNGGKAILSGIIRNAMKKEKLTIGQFAKKAKLATSVVGKLLRQQSDGIRLNRMHAIVKSRSRHLPHPEKKPR